MEEKSDPESANKQVLEYYKKYSQNRDLNKYFSGTSVSYIPEIIIDEDLQPNKPEARNESPTSSVISNKKLEWDNGADIGYDNAHKTTALQKSSSLPSLSKRKHLKKQKSHSNPNSEPEDNVKVIVVTYSDSSDESHLEINIDSSSSESAHSSKQTKSQSTSTPSLEHKTSSDSSSERKLEEFASSLVTLKKKIGDPDAHSTPKLLESRKSDSELIKKQTILQTKEVQTDLLTKSKNKTNLCISKPVTVECLFKLKSDVDKTIQTSKMKCNTIGVQTDNLEDNQASATNQEVIYIEKIDQQSSSRPQTSSEAGASHCDSFEFIPPHQEGSKNLRKNKKIESNRTDHNSGSYTERKSSVEELEKKLELVQRLLKSKKYDSSTKKKCIKKVIAKIIDSKYFEDSSASSELFYPKKTPSLPLRPKSSSTESSEEAKVSLQNNVPWYPVKTRNLQIKTFAQEIMPEPSSKSSSSQPEIIPTETKNVFEGFTLTNNEFAINRDTDEKGSNKSDNASLEKHYESSHNSQKSSSYQNWRVDKTKSEQMMEDRLSRCHGQGDGLTEFADRERDYQLNWIKNEIEHLSKLKSLLEKDKQIKKFTETDNIEVKKNTHVYVVSGCDEGKKSRRNFVIETNLGAQGQDIDFNIGGKKYTVNELNDRHQNSNRRIVGDIDVVSENSTTNIKVVTSCSNCTSAPCKCSLNSNQRDKSSSSKSSSSTLCSTCKKLICICKDLERIQTQVRGRTYPRSRKEAEEYISSDRRISPPSDKQFEEKYQAVKKLIQTCCQPKSVIDEQSQASLFEGVEKAVQAEKSCASQSCQVENDCAFCKARDGINPEPSTCNALKQLSSDEKVLKERSSSLSQNSVSNSKSNSSKSSRSHSSSNYFICSCCKKKCSESARSKSTTSESFCPPCSKVNSNTDFREPNHKCNCYAAVKFDTIRQLKETVGQLQKLEEEVCTCSKTPDCRLEYCLYCSKKLKGTAKTKSSIAYTLTLEAESPSKFKKKKKRKVPLEEIKIKVPCPYYKKKNKDLENKNRKNDDDKCDCKSKPKSYTKHTLQEYLLHNRPDFVGSAEYRRQVVHNNRTEREMYKDDLKLKLVEDNFLTNNVNKKKLFTEKEMKMITRKNYNKLPEVQNKLEKMREKSLREADKLLAEIFTRKIQGCVLKGKKDFPIDFADLEKIVTHLLCKG